MYKNELPFLSTLSQEPSAYAVLKGSGLAPNLLAKILFYKFNSGTLVVIDAKGLPEFSPATSTSPQIGPFGFHIHSGNQCKPTEGPEAFSLAGSHYNPGSNNHPNHAGDLPVLFSNHGYAFMAVYTDKFTPGEIIGKTAIIHQSPDDFRSQPAGNSGIRIACGIIKAI